MPALERQISIRGPKFFRNGAGELQFVHHFDGSTRIGPRDLNPEDREVYAEAWAAFEKEEAGEAARMPLAPMVTFATPEGAEQPPAPVAKGSKAPA